MNREDIIRMAREAEWLHEYDSTTGFVAEAAFKFATLVASAERGAILAVIGDNQCECRCSEVVRDRG